MHKRIDTEQIYNIPRTYRQYSKEFLLVKISAGGEPKNLQNGILNLAPGTSPEKKLVKMGLINLDEFDKISEKRQPDLKNLLQMMSVPVYRGKRLGYVTEPRLASFIATTNSRELLCDPTGSRRFICVEVTRMIPEEPIAYDQLYAQLKQEVLEGERDYLNKEEEKEVQRRNKAYYPNHHWKMYSMHVTVIRKPTRKETG